MTGRRTAATTGGLGILGGTFDPIHTGHLAAAEEARDALGLERILFVPAGDPWQKDDRAVTPAAIRLELVRRAIAGNPAFAVSAIEIDRPGPSYTVETLAALAGAGAAGSAVGPGGLVFVVSVESLAGLSTWHEPARILDLARLAVVPRGGADADALLARFDADFPGRRDRLILLSGPKLEISSTALRARVAAGRSIRYLVPDTVDSAIREYALYRTPTEPAAPAAAVPSKEAHARNA